MPFNMFPVVIGKSLNAGVRLGDQDTAFYLFTRQNRVAFLFCERSGVGCYYDYGNHLTVREADETVVRYGIR